MQEFKKTLLLVPSAYNSKVMGDVSNFIKYYKDIFDVFVIYDKENKVEDGVTYLNKKDKKATYLKYTADYIIDAGSVNGNTRVSTSQKRVSVWHGIPYKKMFTDLDIEYFEEALEYNYGCDLMVSPSKFYTEEFLRKSMLYNGEILETAVSRTDHLYKTQTEKNNLKSTLNIPVDKKVLLYAPTYRQKGKFELPFDAKRLLEILNDGKEEWVIVTKLHYLNELVGCEGVIDCTYYSDVNDILTITDLLITDYSSLMFDYSILKKPCVFYQYDKESYESGRGFMFDLEDYVDKKYIVTKEDELLKIVHKVKDVDNMNKIRKNFYPYQKKDSTKELVEKLNFDASVRNTKDIIFLINDLNQIGGVHSFISNLAREFKKKFNSKVFVFAPGLAATSNDDFYQFDKENLFDIKLSAKDDLDKITDILKGTDGYIISCQFGAYKYFQKYLSGKNNILMFHGDIKDVVKRTLYKWQLNALNNHSLYNYKKLLLLTKGNMDILSKSVVPDVSKTLGYIENSFEFNRKNYYKENGEFAVVSRLDEDKNVFDVLDIFASKKLNKNYKLHVYGDGKLRKEFEQKIIDLKLQKKVIVHGYCSDKEKIYKDKQGIILTSLSEGFSFLLLESANYGVPIYLYDSFTAVREFDSYSCVKKVEPSNINQFVETLNKDLTFDKKDFDKIEKLFCNETILSKWLQLFDEIENLESVSPSFKQRFKNRLLNYKTKFINKIVLLSQKIFKNNIRLRSDIILNLNYVIYRIKNFGKKKKQPLVSLVVPFYNNNDVLDNLLKSIKKSGYKNYEVLLINDGSEQDPSDIYNKYEKIKYFYKKNGGPGDARNFGIDKCNGKYVFFIDADDTLCKYALNYLVDFAERKKLDLVGGRCRKIPFDSKITTYWFRKIYSKTYINTLDKRHLLLQDTISTVKLYNLKKLKESGIKFQPGLYEDKLYMAYIYQYFDKIGIVNKDIYNWFSYGSGTSITTSYVYDNVKERINKMNIIFNHSLDKFKMYYVTNAITHDLMVFANNYKNFSSNDQKRIFKLYLDYFNDKEKYIYLYNIKEIYRKELFLALMNNDFERFDRLATGTCVKFRKKRNILDE